MLAVAVSGTLAYIITRTDAVKNTFTPATLSTDITEDFKNNVKSNVKITVQGEIKAFVRAQIIVTWQDGNGNVSSKAPVLGTDYSLTIGDGWTKVGDHYYHNTAVEPGAAPKGVTSVLISECKVLSGANQPDGYTLHVEILSQAVQAEPITAAQQLWGYVPGSSTTTETE